MKFTRNQYQQNQINGQSFTIKGFRKDGQVTIQTKGKLQTVRCDDLLHADYRYVDTVHSSQGRTAECCIYVAGTDNPPAIGRESFYVAASRARQEFTVYTANAQNLGLWVHQSRAQENALPLIAEQPLIHNQFNQVAGQNLQQQQDAKQQALSAILHQETPSSQLNQLLRQPLQKISEPGQSPTRDQEFRLLVQTKYLVEEKGEPNPQNSQEKIYRSADGTELRCSPEHFRIIQGNSELEFGKDNAAIKNTFSFEQMQAQINARTAEAQRLTAIDRSINRGWSISR